MPVSKRDRVIHTSKVRKHDKSEKSEQIESIRDSLNSHRYAYVISVSNERNNILKEIRDELKPGKMFYSKNKLVQVALGLGPDSEVADGVHSLCAHLSGTTGLVCTDHSPAELENLLGSHDAPEFARAGSVATSQVDLAEGFDTLAPFPHSMETQLRKLGLPTLLHDGKIRMLANHVVCREGDVLTADQSQLLKFLGIRMAKFHVGIKAYWDKESSQVTELI
jgi:mRNA turnover protein 4